MPKRASDKPPDGPPVRPVRQPPRPAGAPAAQHASATSSGGGQALLVVTGSDHPGILDDISHYVGEHRARIEALRVVNLRGRFALLMLIAGADESLRKIAANLGLLMERTGVRATLEATQDANGAAAMGTSFALSAIGGADADESTVLGQLSNLLRVLNVNMRDVDTKRTTAGGFEILTELDVPRDVPVGTLRDLLGQLLNQHPLRWDLSAAAPT